MKLLKEILKCSLGIVLPGLIILGLIIAKRSFNNIEVSLVETKQDKKIDVEVEQRAPKKTYALYANYEYFYRSFIDKAERYPEGSFFSHSGFICFKFEDEVFVYTLESEAYFSCHKERKVKIKIFKRTIEQLKNTNTVPDNRTEQTIERIVNSNIRLSHKYHWFRPMFVGLERNQQFLFDLYSMVLSEHSDSKSSGTGSIKETENRFLVESSLWFGSYNYFLLLKRCDLEITVDFEFILEIMLQKIGYEKEVCDMIRTTIRECKIFNLAVFSS